MRIAVAVRDEEVFPALAALGVSRNDLLEAVRMGEWARASVHPYDTPTYAGQTRNTHIIRHLSILYVPKGWQRVNDHGASFLLSPDGKTAIMTARGDENTGSPHLKPKTLFPKGIVTATLAVQNVEQVGPVPTAEPEIFPLFPDLAEAEPDAPDITTLKKIPPDATAFVLLTDQRAGELVAELSVPVRLDDAGYVVDWYPRILLGNFAIGEPASDEPTEGPAVDIDITPL